MASISPEARAGRILFTMASAAVGAIVGGLGLGTLAPGRPWGGALLVAGVLLLVTAPLVTLVGLAVAARRDAPHVARYAAGILLALAIGLLLAR